jgi:hypothetical protein
MEYLLQASSVPGLTQCDEIDSLLQVSDICMRIGLIRKHACFRYIAALKCVEFGRCIYLQLYIYLYVSINLSIYTSIYITSLFIYR